MEWVHVHSNAAARERIGRHEIAGRKHGPLRLRYSPNSGQTWKLRRADLCGDSARDVRWRDHALENPAPHSTRVDLDINRVWRPRS